MVLFKHSLTQMNDSPHCKQLAVVGMSYGESEAQHLLYIWYQQQHFNITVFNTKHIQNMLALYTYENSMTYFEMQVYYTCIT